MADTWYTNPLDVATQGLLSGQPFTIAVQGFLVRIEEGFIADIDDLFIDELSPTVITPAGELVLDPAKTGGGVFEEEPIRKKWVKVTVLKNNKEYWQTKEIVDVNVRIQDIRIFISEGVDKKPIVKVEFPNEKID